MTSLDHRDFLEKKKDPQTYDGSTDLEIYLQHFEWVAKYNHWTSAEKAQQLAISLKGDAQQVFRDLDPGSIREYDDIRRVLLQRFNPPGREAAYRCQFKNRKRIETESISDYGYALKHLSAKAYPELDRLARETYVIDQFISGLNSSDSENIRIRHSESVDEAIAWAIEYKALEGPRTLLRKLKNSEMAERDLATIVSEEKLTSEIKSLKTSRKYKCKYCQKWDNPFWKCPKKSSNPKDSSDNPQTQSSNNVNANSELDSRPIIQHF